MATKLPKINDPSTWGGEGENIYGQKYGTRKDQFGFGTEQPISQEDMLKMERSKLDKLLSMGEITQDEYTDMYKQLQDTISGIEKKNESLLGRFIERQTSGTYYDIPSGETKRWEK